MPVRSAAAHPPAALGFAWIAAALFAASLAYFLYTYLVTFGRAAARGAPSAIVADILLFTAFAAHHSIFARARPKRWLASATGPSLERAAYSAIASVLFLVVCAAWRPVPGELYQLAGVPAAIGYAVQAAGLVVTARGSARLDVLDLAGVRQVLRARSGVGPSHVPLETSGLYGFVRHPLYFGWALFVWGTPHLTATRAVFAAVSTAYLALAIVFEERALIETFGDDYRRYRERVRWRMIPGIY